MVLVILTVVVTMALVVKGAPFFELTLHKHVMHRPVFGLSWPLARYASTAHGEVHHGKFKADASYLLANHSAEDQLANKRLITMAWWNQFVLVPAASLPFVPAIFFGFWWIWLTALFTEWAYYGAYEGIHWCMHNPSFGVAKGKGFYRLLNIAQRVIESTRLYAWLNAHHWKHHKNPSVNLNVVAPVADWLLRTRQRPTEDDLIELAEVMAFARHNREMTPA